MVQREVKLGKKRSEDGNRDEAGWLIEGVLVQTVYEDIPLSISFTGVAWHALISLCGGWLLLRRALCWSPARMALLSAGAGLVYGFRAVSWWVETPDQVFPAGLFFLYSLLATLPLVAAYRVLEHLDNHRILIRKGISVALVEIISGLFLVGSAQVAPVSLVVFPLLMVAVFLPLRHNRAVEVEGEAVDMFREPVRPGNYWLLLLIPLMASLLYWLGLTSGICFPSHWIVYLVTTPLGFYLFIRSVWKIYRHPEKKTCWAVSVSAGPGAGGENQAEEVETTPVPVTDQGGREAD